MNKKIAILLSSVVAGVGLVGATFAAWAVTDNADPFGIKISPGDITDDITYDTLTLDWGDTSKFVMVKNLKVTTATEDNSVLRYVQVKATDSKTGDTKGSLTVTFEDETEGHGNEFTGHKLIDYLTVKVYKVASDSTVPSTESVEISLPKVVETVKTFTDTKDITVPNGSVQNLAFKIELPETGITSQIYEEMKNDVVNLKIDWNKSSTHTDAEGTIIYYSGTLDNAFTPKVYAWSTTSIATNGKFGTVNMEQVPNTNVYSYVLKNTFDRVIFIYGQTAGDNPQWKQTGDITVTEAARSTTPMYVYSNDENPENDGWEALSLVEHGYYLVGSMNGWKASSEYKLPEPVSGTIYTTEVTVSAAQSAQGGIDFKVLDTRTNQYYSEYDINGGSNFNLGEAGTYTLQFDTEHSFQGGYAYIYAQKQ